MVHPSENDGHPTADPQSARAPDPGADPPSEPADGPTLPELISQLEQQHAEAKRLGRLAREDRLLSDVLDALRSLDGSRLLSTTQAAARLSVTPETVARWCREDHFPHAFKTGENDDGEWRIPAGDVDAFAPAPHVDPERVRYDLN